MAAEEHKQQEQQAPQQLNLSKAILRIQSALLDLPRCEDYQLLAAGSVLSRPDYEDVITERCIAGLCGYPLCPNQLTSNRPHRGRYRISLREHRVYDLQESYSFCSEECLIGSRAFAGILSAERCSDLSHARILQVLALFDKEEGSKVSDAQEEEKKKGASLDNDDLGLSKLSIREKSEIEVCAGDMPWHDWAGPSNAIEGYVPQRDRESGSVRKLKSKPQSSNLKLQSSSPSPTENMDMTEFTSEILCCDELLTFHANDFSSSSHSKSMNKSTRNINDGFTTKVDLLSTNNMIVEDNPHVSSAQQDVSISLPNVIDSQLENSEDGVSQGSHGQVQGQKLKSSLKCTKRRGENHAVKWADMVEQKDSLTKDGETQSRQGDPKTKSSLKSSVKKCQIRTVKWADGGEGNHSLAKDDDSERIPCLHKQSDSDGFVCAQSFAAGPLPVQEMGESNVENTASDAETILPLPIIGEALDSHSDSYEEDPTCNRYLLKWPKKSVLESDIYDMTDSWHDTPPEGFNLTLSTFASMWMALFGWISCSSVTYIYGRNEESWEDFSFVNGREYPRKTCLSDGRSLEIKHTLGGCLERCLPQVVLDLRLPTTVSIIEKAMWQLLETMSFMDAIPPFKTKEWHVIVLLFIDALSVFRIPALNKHMSDNRVLLHKFLDVAGIGKDEYETMKDLLLRLGRSPLLSAKSGA